MRLMAGPRKAQSSVTSFTKVVPHNPPREQCSLAGKRCGHLAGSMGMGCLDFAAASATVVLVLVVVVAVAVAVASAVSAK